MFIVTESIKANTWREQHYYGPFADYSEATNWAQRQQKTHNTLVAGDPDRPSIEYKTEKLLEPRL